MTIPGDRPDPQRRGRTVLGIDPGLTRCGLGAVTASAGRQVRIVDVGLAATPADQQPERRLLAIAEAIDTWMDRLKPDAVAVERVFAQSNVSTVTGTAQVAGLAMVAAARRGIPVALHTPSEVKAAITGNGRAGKEQVTTMVTRILNLATPPRPADAADALALAICHAWRSGGPRATSSAPTAAQEIWAQAEARAKRSARRVAATRGVISR